MTVSAICVSDSDFSSVVSEGYALVDFWAEWCGPCRNLAPIIDEVAKELVGKVAVCKLNIDESPEIASQTGIKSIPTLVLFKDGKKIDMKVGAMPKNALLSWVRSHTEAQIVLFCSDLELRLLIAVLIQKIREGFDLVPKIGIELEFYLSHGVDPGAVSAAVGLDLSNERGPQQYEVDVGYKNDLSALCDDFYRTRHSLEVAVSSLGGSVVFDPKPLLDDYGSAAHYNVSLHDIDGANVLDVSLAKTPGIIHSIIAAMLSMTNSSLYFLTLDDTANFNRFVPHFMAPVNLSWGGNNRTTLIRIPDSDPQHRRIEYRLPSPQTKPERVILFLLTAILEGLQRPQSPNVKIYGNAHDDHYKIDPIITDIVILKKSFQLFDVIDRYIALQRFFFMV